MSFPQRKKILIDSSVLIAAAISSKGFARDLINRVLKGEFELYISELILEETERNIAYKVPKALPALELFFQILPAHIINPQKDLVIEISQVIELKDAPIIAAARVVQVDFLVSFDQKHILSQRELIKERFGITVITPDQLVRSN